MLEVTNFNNYDFNGGAFSKGHYATAGCTHYSSSRSYENRDVMSKMYMMLHDDLLQNIKCAEHSSMDESMLVEECDSEWKTSGGKQASISWPVSSEPPVNGEMCKQAHLASNLTIKVRVPVKVVGLVVGPKGATIKRIQRITNTFIITPSGNSDPVFTITGKEENVNDAKNQIKMHIMQRTGSVIEPNILVESCVKCEEWADEIASSASPSFYGVNLMEEPDRKHDQLDSAEFLKAYQKFCDSARSSGRVASSRTTGVMNDAVPITPARRFTANRRLNAFAAGHNYHGLGNSNNSNGIHSADCGPIPGEFIPKRVIFNADGSAAPPQSPQMTYSVVGYNERIDVEQLLKTLENKMKLEGTLLDRHSSLETPPPRTRIAFCIMCFQETCGDENYLLSCDHTLCMNCVERMVAESSHCPICGKQIVTLDSLCDKPEIF